MKHKKKCEIKRNGQQQMRNISTYLMEKKMKQG